MPNAMTYHVITLTGEDNIEQFHAHEEDGINLDDADWKDWVESDAFATEAEQKAFIMGFESGQGNLEGIVIEKGQGYISL